MTGLAVAIGSVVILGVLMRVTANADWRNAFADGRPVRQSFSTFEEAIVPNDAYPGPTA